MAPSIILLSGGPGSHDASWANHVAAPLLMTDTPATNQALMGGSEVSWLVHRPPYDARWRHDLVSNKAETDRVRGAGASDYVDLLRRRAKERGWSLRCIDDASSFWTHLTTFQEPIRKLLYWGHAQGDLWLAPGHSVSSLPDSRDVIRVADIAEAVRRDPELPWRFRGSEASRMHQFIASNSSDFARAWSKQLKVWSQGVTGTLDFNSIHTGGGMPSLNDRSDIHSFDDSGAERARGLKWGGTDRPRVLIDPGHGGHEDMGRSSAFGGRGAQGTLEKEVTLDVARRVAARLGGHAQLTRASDQNLPLGERAQQAARAGADVFVSIHADSGRPEAHGAETWVHPEAGAGSRALALGMQRSLDRLGGRYGGSGSTLEGRMAVLTPALLGGRTSACLVEIDNLSSPRGEQRLRDPGYRQAVGDAIAGAIHAHLEGSRLGGARAVASATDPQVGWIDPEIDYSKGLGEVNKAWTDWFHKYELWQAPVTDTTYFPHSAICQLTMTSAAGNQAYGTGFFIGKNRILTCGHNFLYAPKGWQAAQVRIAPGQDGNTKPFGTSSNFTVATNVEVHADYKKAFDAGNYSRDFDLAVIRTEGFPAPGNLYFDMLEENQSRNIVLCGYGRSSELEPFKQYMDGGYVAQLVGDEVLNYPIMMRPGHSGSPVFRQDSMEVIAVNTFALSTDQYFNYGCRLNDKKIKWIRSC